MKDKRDKRSPVYITRAGTIIRVCEINTPGHIVINDLLARDVEDRMLAIKEALS
jgi:hypothetical protein